MQLFILKCLNINIENSGVDYRLQITENILLYSTYLYETIILAPSSL